MRASRLPVLLASLALAAGALACETSGAGRSKNGQRIEVLASFSVLADLVREVGGERVSVRSIVPGGADPNTFQPPAREVLAVDRAALVVLNGLAIDRTVRTLVANAARPDLPVVTLSDGLPTLESGLSSLSSASGGRGNPYLWLDPRLAERYVVRIGEALQAVDPPGAATYRERGAAYVARLRALDLEVEQTLSAIPAEQRKLVTVHDGFPYFAARYGFELVGVVIRTPGREPSAQEVAEVARSMQRHAVPTVFTEPQVDARLLKLAARDAGLNISTLYSDTLDQTVTSYEALLRYNARHLVNGLQ